ncbi:uncharacterized protein LOC143464666 [Clavelina lepadiformis]|uniref:uncharacterized protein LOC143464666 n=1 Tax=Clavelina lepadiformis TaxID=159417 RepID=UPI004042CD44
MKIGIAILAVFHINLAVGMPAVGENITEYLMSIYMESLTDRYIPDNKMVPPMNTTVSYIALSTKTNIDSKKLTLSWETAEQIVSEETFSSSTTNSSKKQFFFGGENRWSDYGCCRRTSDRSGEGRQVRVQLVSRFLKFQSRRCTWNFCQPNTCRNWFSICSEIKRRLRDVCFERSQYYDFMMQYCGPTCGSCSGSGSSPSFPNQGGPPYPNRPGGFFPNQGGLPFPNQPGPSFPNQGGPYYPNRPGGFFPNQGPSTRPPFFPASRPTPEPLYREVKVYFRMTPSSNALSYKYVISPDSPPSPWKPVSDSTSPGEITSFHLYTRATSDYGVAVRFCKLGKGSNEVWQVVYSSCPPGWMEEYVLYASSLPRNQAMFVFVSNSDDGQGTEMTRLHTGSACCNYLNTNWFFFAPDLSSLPQTTLAPPSTMPTDLFNRFTPPTDLFNRFTPPGFGGFPFPTRPSPTNGFFTPPYPATQPPFTPFPNQPSPGSGNPPPQSDFAKECFDRHNFFRAVHNTPALQWDPTLASFAQKWANFLLAAAPDHPNQPRPGTRRTPNWPHSEGKGVYRARNAGENIAWDKSTDGSPAWESVLRWYAEIFDYNKNNPTRSSSGNPVGHYTQMLWKDTKYLGCARAVDNLQSNGRFTLQSSYTVAHYAPAGNIRYPTPDQTTQVYNSNVQDPRQGTCMSDRCSRENRCMGFDSSISCSCGAAGPECRSRSGNGSGQIRCMAVCSSSGGFSGYGGSYTPFISECEGKNSCICSSQPVNGIRGAICT